MINFNNFHRIATAAVGALIISTACVAAAVGPAASVGQPVAYATTSISASAQANA